MNNNKRKPDCDEAREMDMVVYLFSLGHQPKKVHRNDYWYLSPLRSEKTASVKLNRAINRWYDHGIGKGENLIDFAILNYNCTITELLQKLQNYPSFHAAVSRHPEQPVTVNKITVRLKLKMSSFSLLNYLKQCSIPVGLAEPDCPEIRYQLRGKIYYAIGFKNDAGRYELRHQYFKKGSSPKAVTPIKNAAVKCAVFKGFFDFLSFLFLVPMAQHDEWDFCMLNSLSFFEKARPFLAQYNAVHLFLDNDRAGQNCSHCALQSDKRYIDESSLYVGFKDLNEWIVNMGKQPTNTDDENPP